MHKRWDHGIGTALRSASGILAAVALVALAQVGCSRRPQDRAEPGGLRPESTPYKETLWIMGTSVTVTLYPPDGVSGRVLARQAFAAVDEVDRCMSDYRADSEVSQLNAQAGGPYVRVSASLYDVVLRAGYFSRLSGGAFDPTIRPLLKLWQEAGKAGRLPSTDELEAARALVGWRGICPLAWTGNRSAPALRLAKPGMQLDLGGIAKGYAVDQAVLALRAAGVRHALVNAGGDLYAMGSHPDGRPWVVAIQMPGQEGVLLPQTLSVVDRSVATSGDYRRYVEIQGHRYSHIIDPRTGRPVEHMASVTVVAPNATDADALATALSVLRPEAGLALAESLPAVETLIIVRNVSGQLETRPSSGFQALLTAPPPAR